MSRVVLIPGCGPMACSTYVEVAAAIDRAYASPPDQPLPLARVFAELAEGAGLRIPPPGQRSPGHPFPEPG